MKTLLNVHDRSEVLDRLANVRSDAQPRETLIKLSAFHSRSS